MLINNDLPDLVLKRPIIIEITGIPGTCKHLISDAVSKRLGFPYMRFPNFDPFSYTGKALLAALNEYPDRFPEWWALLSAANFYEQGPLINKLSPKIINNYKTGYRAWMHSAGFDAKHLVKSLPEPNLVYSIVGETFLTPGDLEQHHLPLTCSNLVKYFNNPRGQNWKKIDNLDKKFKAKGLTARLNKIVDYICNDIVNKYNVPKTYNYEIQTRIISSKVAERNKKGYFPV